jgi:hypothetical protein
MASLVAESSRLASMSTGGLSCAVAVYVAGAANASGALLEGVGTALTTGSATSLLATLGIDAPVGLSGVLAGLTLIGSGAVAEFGAYEVFDYGCLR